MYTKLSDEDRLTINYLKSMLEEYGDPLMKEEIEYSCIKEIGIFNKETNSWENILAQMVFAVRQTKL